jgi:DNA-binding CsgD family transcriptional regulator
VPGPPAALGRHAYSGLLERAVAAQRAAEREAIGNLLARARRGRSGTLVVRGEAGVGKTALLADAVEQADGMRVLHGAGVESEVELPFAALHQLLFPVLDHIDRLPRPQARALRGAFGLAEAEADPFLIALGVLGLLADVARESPLLVVMDDAQWLDQLSAGALVFAARRLQGEPIALLLAAQEGAAQRFDAPGLPALRLRGLDPAAAAALLQERAGQVALEVRERLVAETGGNPVALLELTEALSAAQLAGRQPLPARLPIGAGLRRAFLARVRRLPSSSQTLLLVAAAEESGAVAPVLAAAAMLGVGAEALEPAEQAGLLRVVDQALEFQHPLVRSAVYQDATFGAKRAVHRALAQVLGGVEEDDDRRVWHLVAAAIGPDEELAEALEGSARRAHSEGEPVAAAGALQRASALSIDAATRADRLVAAAGAAWQAGRPAWSHELLDQAALLSDDRAVRARISNVRGAIELESGTPWRARGIFVEGAELVMASKPRLAAEMLAMAGQSAWMAGDGDSLIETGRRMLRLPGPEGFQVKQVARSLLWLGRMLQGAPDGPIPSGAAIRWPKAENPRLWLWPPLVSQLLGDDEAADGLCTEAVATMRVRGIIGPLPFALAQLALVELMTGRWPGALAHATEALHLARETGQTARAAGITIELAWLAAVQGRADDCRRLAGEAFDFAMPGRSTMIMAGASWALGLLDLAEGRPAEAFDRLVTLTTVYRSPPVLALAAADLAEAAVRAGQPEPVADALAELERWTRHAGRPWARLASHRCRALTSGNGDAERHFQAALEEDRRARRPFERARTELLYGEWLRRERRRYEARTHLRSALGLFQQLGAAPWMERARLELLATGETARKRNLDAFFQLTPQELQIARLAGQGLTNREIAAQLYLSGHTVSYHLHKIFRKLGITSRVSLRTLDLEEWGNGANGGEPAG